MSTNLNELNEYSCIVFEYLKKNNTELLENLSLKPSIFGKKYIVIEIATKNENSASNLFLSSEYNELTVGFDSYHCHFDNFREQDFEEEMKNALKYFYKILNEELFVVCAGGGVTTLLTNEEINIIESGQKLEKFDYDCITFYITSWSGKYDRVFKNPN